MFFRIWFLYLSKLALLLGAVLLVTLSTPRFAGGPVERIAFWALLTLGISITAIAVALLIRPRIHCPACGQAGEFVLCGQQQPGVDCPTCGTVYAKNLITSFQLRVEPHDEEPMAKDAEETI